MRVISPSEFGISEFICYWQTLSEKYLVSFDSRSFVHIKSMRLRSNKILGFFYVHDCAWNHLPKWYIATCYFFNQCSMPFEEIYNPSNTFVLSNWMHVCYSIYIILTNWFVLTKKRNILHKVLLKNNVLINW